MLNRKFIGQVFDPLVVEIEKGQLKFFAKATGADDPIYTDECAAKAAGYRALPAPPTFGFTLGLAKADPFDLYTKIGVDMTKALHGEQQFEYLEPICAGDTITLQDKVANIFEKKGGALEFVTIRTSAKNQNNTLVAKMVRTIVVRNA
ncbi:MAG: MaoC family dehydratase N-terminal domain-containing protein [Hyphomonas sp.]